MTNSDSYDLDPNQYLTTGQAAFELRLSPGTLANWRASPKVTGPRYIKHRRNVYYLKSEIEAYKRKHFKMFSSTEEWRESVS